MLDNSFNLSQSFNYYTHYLFYKEQFKTELEFFNKLWGLGTEEEEGYRTGPPGYICWRNLFLGIDSWAP